MNLLDELFGDLDPITLRDVTNSLKWINTRVAHLPALIA